MRSADDIREMKPYCDAFLIGSSIMVHDTPGEETRGVRMRIKCCGITRPEDARYAEACGADAIGVVVFSPTSKRSVTPERAREIFDAVGPFTTTVAVSHTTSTKISNRSLHCTRMQSRYRTRLYSGKNRALRVIRVIGRNDPLPEDCDAIIVDESHGSGKRL